MNALLSFLEMQGVWELVASVLALGYLVLLMRENALAWPLGIVSSAIFVVLFFKTHFYYETLLYLFYVLAGFYGWWYWKFGKKRSLDAKVVIVEWPLGRHLLIVLFCSLLSVGLGAFMENWRPEASYPYFDAFTTVFAFFATFMESRKVLSGWWYWMIINPASAVLYWLKDFRIAPWLMLVYTVLSVIGYWQWRKTYLLQLEEHGSRKI